MTQVPGNLSPNKLCCVNSCHLNLSIIGCTGCGYGLEKLPLLFLLQSEIDPASATGYESQQSPPLQEELPPPEDCSFDISTSKGESFSFAPMHGYPSGLSQDLEDLAEVAKLALPALAQMEESKGKPADQKELSELVEIRDIAREMLEAAEVKVSSAHNNRRGFATSQQMSEWRQIVGGLSLRVEALVREDLGRNQVQDQLQPGMKQVSSKAPRFKPNDRQIREGEARFEEAYQRLPPEGGGGGSVAPLEEKEVLALILTHILRLTISQTRAQNLALNLTMELLSGNSSRD